MELRKPKTSQHDCQIISHQHLGVFGCLAFATTSAQGSKKFDPRSNPSIFIGYPFGTKGYKFLDLNTYTTFVSCNVIFRETIFPLHSKTTSLMPNPLPFVFTKLLPDSISYPPPHIPTTSTSSPVLIFPTHPLSPTSPISSTPSVLLPHLCYNLYQLLLLLLVALPGLDMHLSFSKISIVNRPCVTPLLQLTLLQPTHLQVVLFLFLLFLTINFLLLYELHYLCFLSF